VNKTVWRNKYFLRNFLFRKNIMMKGSDLDKAVFISRVQPVNVVSWSVNNGAILKKPLAFKRGNIA
jgi:hypothetical protein